jgi:DNA-binding NarL/FixJ family response regulator
MREGALLQPMMDSVILLDEHALSRAGLRALLEHELGFRVVADGARLDETAARAASVVIVGSNDAGAALGTIRLLAAAARPPACIRLDTAATADSIKAAFDAGALGYLLRSDGTPALDSAVRAAAAGQRYLSPGASSALVDHLQHRDPSLPHHALTRRQIEVLRLVAQGRSTKTIARDLGLSTKTVDAHRYQIGKRLQVHDVAGLVRYAIRHALVGNET